jgi:hypothetical protein
MRSTFQNSGMSLSIGVFFSLMIAGLASTLPRTLTAGLTSRGVPLATASSIAHLPPVSTVFAAMLGYNPVHNLLEPTGLLTTLPPHDVAVLTGTQFFPTLISGPFHHGLMIVFTAAAIMSVTGAVVSLLRGKPVRLPAPQAGEQGAAQEAGHVGPAVNGAPAGPRPAYGGHPNGYRLKGATGDGHAASRQTAGERSPAKTGSSE